VPKDGDEMVFFSKYSLPAGIAYAILLLSYLSAKVFSQPFCSSPFPKDDFTALLPHCSLPAMKFKNYPLPSLYICRKNQMSFSYSRRPRISPKRKN
jgi:hypothetical protein